MEDKRIKRKIVKTDAQAMELLELNNILVYRYGCNYLGISIIKRLDFPTLARECDRYGISDRAAASFARAVSQDIGIVNEGDTSHMVDLNKILRQRKKV
ncbi:hypothetical protein AVEN_153923-1 [Araneus ventricosus]|uniref:Uncharacterized protein n=1 Tax=Araneus ventricosus TaxID=182803 RepID=A0A4Y2F7P2_ARAVE|nr:hypothetical protein AVEN_153923-1 [Araneus ventricosus]